MRIKTLTLYTDQLGDQKQFYSQVLGLPLKDESENTVSFKIGNSVLTFKQGEGTTPYHYAINIPANKENEALDWLKERVAILKDGEHEIQDFDFWNAKAIYFYDPDQNIVELIARRNLENTSDKTFDQNGFLEISEIGMPTTDVKNKYDKLHELTGISVFSGDFNRFCAIGDDRGLSSVSIKTSRTGFRLMTKRILPILNFAFSKWGRILTWFFQTTRLVSTRPDSNSSCIFFNFEPCALFFVAYWF